MCCVVAVGGWTSWGSNRHFSAPVTGSSAITVANGVQMYMLSPTTSGVTS